MKLLLLLLLLPVFCIAQTDTEHPFPQQQINEAIQKGWDERGNPIPVPQSTTQLSKPYQSGIHHYLEEQYLGQTATSRLQASTTMKSDGILYIGATPHDTMVVTGAWQNTGSVAVVNDGVLIFNNAQATISGSLVVVGNGQVIANNSSFLFPQQYFYQWGFEGDGHGLLQMRHCTLDFNNMATPWSMTDSSTFNLQNVYFTSSASTIGVNGHASFIVDTANLLGEIVATDTILLSLRNVDTVIVWHHVQRGAGLTWTFPNGYQLQHYAIGPDSPGVSGLQYNIELDNIAQVHWAVMPENETNVNISHSTVRSVAVIFRGTDNANVQNLTDNASYTTSPAFFTDRTFTLDSCTLQTWGIYPTDTTHVNITSCITGEIGTSGMAETSCSSAFSDGSGGYFWASGKGFQTASGCGMSCSVRAEQGGTVVTGFCSIAAATGYAIDSGLLIMIQTPTISPPIAYDGSDIWVGMLTPQTGDSGYVVPLTGSAYILRGPTSHLMSFASYYVAWQPSGGNTWTITDSIHTTPVDANTLANWNTTGLATGSYNLQLIIKDNYGDGVTVPSGFNLVTGTPTGITGINNNDVSVFPNPATNRLTLCGNEPGASNVELLNMLGQTVFNYHCADGINVSLNIDISNVPAGFYIYRITTENGKISEGRVVKM